MMFRTLEVVAVLAVLGVVAGGVCGVCAQCVRTPQCIFAGEEEQCASVPAAKVVKKLPLDDVVKQLRSSAHQLDGGFFATVSYRGEVVLSQGFGYARKEHPRVEPCADDFFRLGSVTKILTSALTMRLCKIHAISLDDKLSTLLPELRLVSRWPGFSADPTVRQLLSHSAGIPRETPCPEGSCNITTQEALQRINGSTLVFPSGRRTEYSNLGFDLLGHALARVFNSSYADALQSFLLRPMGLPNTKLELSAEEEEKFLAYGAASKREATVNLGWGAPDGQGYITGEDLAAFVSALSFCQFSTQDSDGSSSSSSSGGGDGFTAGAGVQGIKCPLDAALFVEWFQAVMLHPDGQSAYGLAWEAQRSANDNAWLWGKSGNIARFSAQLLVDTDQGLAVGVVSNEGSATDLANAIMATMRPSLRQAVNDMVAAAAFPSPINASALTGVYEAVVPSAGGRLNINITQAKVPGTSLTSASSSSSSSELRATVSAMGLSFPFRVVYSSSLNVFVLAAPPAVQVPCILDAELGLDGEVFRFVHTKAGNRDLGIVFPHLFVGNVFHSKA